MDDVRKKYIDKIWQVAIIILFIVLTIFVSSFHEHWSDESQSFLLARDNSFHEIFQYIKYEGTPALWFIIIKIFILLGGTYETFYVLPIIFSSIGIAIFEFKITAPWYIKTLFPFTYFIFFQYSIVARSYCLIFPMLMIISILYPKRLKKPILYSGVLFIFMNISLHTFVLAVSLYLLFLMDMYMDGKFKNKKNIAICIFILFEFLITMIYFFPSKDCSFHGNGGESIWHIISEATIGSNINMIFEVLTTIVVCAVIGYASKDNLNNIIRLVICIVPLILILMLITYQGWHVGIVFLVLFTYLITTKMIEKKIIKYFFIFVFSVQIFWTVSSVNYDLDRRYSATEEVAAF